MLKGGSEMRARGVVILSTRSIKDQRGSRSSVLKATGTKGLRFLLNGIPARWANASYNVYSRIYQGQLRFGLPVPKNLLKSQEEIRNRAAAKLALSLYHIFFRITKTRIPRNEIKLVLLDEMDKGTIRLTEDVIFLTEDDLGRIASDRFHIPGENLAGILAEARRRRILKETLREHTAPAYFESEIEESEQNGRGDYEVVHYRDFTDEGKSIGFRRLASMEAVTSGDNRPSLLMVPGIGCNSDCFNLNNRHSIAKDLADMGCWVYLFDPRGLGVNKGKFDPLLTIDTMIDYDLAAITRFIFRRSRGKPVILVSHSMGGIVAEYMVLNWNLRLNFDKLHMLSDAQRDRLDKVLPPLEEASAYLAMVRGVVSLGSPKFFEKLSHPIFPYSLWLNHISRIFRLKKVPFRESIWFVTHVPGVRTGTKMAFNTNLAGLNPLISPENHKDDREFIIDYFRACGESFPLGLGFQFLKAIYNGEGFKRMDQTRLNYSSLLSFFPRNIPIFHFWGTEDPLSPPTNLRFSQSYPHRIKQAHHIHDPEDLRRIEISTDRSQAVDFVVEGANHLDLLYGKKAEEVVHPLLFRVIRQAWAGWAYPNERQAA
jgi:pimeloyl-ACP methyl ester carboxylesterase